MKILLANFSKMVNDSGGAAKVFCAFANEMCLRGHDVAMMYCDDKEGDFFYHVNEKARAINLQHAYGKHIAFPKRMKIKRELLRVADIRRARKVNDDFIEEKLLGNIRRALDEISPEVIVSWQPAASKSFIMDIKTKSPVITMSHGDPEDYFHTYPVSELPAIERSTVNQVLIPSFQDSLKKRFPNIKTVAIGNVVPQYEEMAELDAEKESYKIIFLARLVKNHKRPHIFVEAFIKLAKEFPQWHAELWGADDKLSYTKSMQKKIDQAGLGDRIKFMGTTHEVASVLKQGDIFAFPSAYEGWGMSLTEAMSMGLPAVGFKNCSAVNELIENGKTGFLTDDGVDSFAEGLRKLMLDRSLRCKMGTAARQAMKPYKAENIWNTWEKLLQEIVDDSVKKKR